MIGILLEAELQYAVISFNWEKNQRVSSERAALFIGDQISSNVHYQHLIVGVISGEISSLEWRLPNIFHN